MLIGGDDNGRLQRRFRVMKYRLVYVSRVCKAMMKSGDRAQFEGLRRNRKLTVLQIGRSALESALRAIAIGPRDYMQIIHPISCA
jgi:hypothetical protein